jgi:hypothetical protein
VPLCDVGQHDTVDQLQITFTFKSKTSSVILEILKILIQKLFTGHTIPQKQETLPIFGGNYARGSWMFESGFIGLTITSPV